jgi:hypothetical protein
MCNGVKEATLEGLEMAKSRKVARKGRGAVQESMEPMAVDVAIATASWSLAEVVYDALCEVPHDARIMAALAMLPEVSF